MKIVDIIQLCTLIIGDKNPDYVMNVEQLNRVLNLVNLRIFKKKLGLPEGYDPQHPEAAEAYGRTIDELRHFKVDMGTQSPPLVLVNGFANIPTNFFYPLSMVSKQISGGKVKYGRVDMLSELQFQERLPSSITKPTLRDAIARFNAGQIQVLPVEIQYVMFSYYRLPATPFYAVTYANGWAEYEPKTTVEFEYDSITVLDAIPMILQELGFSIPLQEVLTYSQKLEAKGV